MWERLKLILIKAHASQARHCASFVHFLFFFVCSLSTKTTQLRLNNKYPALDAGCDCLQHQFGLVEVIYEEKYREHYPQQKLMMCRAQGLWYISKS